MPAVAATPDAAVVPPGNFDMNTQRQVFPLTAKTRVSGATDRVEIPHTGFTARIRITVRGTVGTVTGAPHTLGTSAIIRQVRVILNTGQEIYRLSGPSIFHLARWYQEGTYDPLGHTNGRVAITTGLALVLDFYIPLAVTLRDSLGLVTTQSNQLLCTVLFDWETDANLAATSITWTTQPVATYSIENFTVPPDVRNWPRTLARLHSFIESTTAIATAVGDYPYVWPLGNTYLGMYHGYGFAVSGADNWSRVKFRVAQTNVLYEYVPADLDLEMYNNRGLARPLGVIPFDFLGTAGQGSYGSPRDIFNSARYSDIVTLLTTTATGTLYSVARMIVAQKT